MSRSQSRTATYNRIFRTDAMYWAPGTPTGYGGETFDGVVGIKVLYDPKIQEITDATGRRVISQHTAYTQTPVLAGGYIALGDAETLDPVEAKDPFSQEHPRRILLVDVIPRMDGNSAFTIAYLGGV